MNNDTGRVICQSLLFSILICFFNLFYFFVYLTLNSFSFSVSVSVSFDIAIHSRSLFDHKMLSQNITRQKCEHEFNWNWLGQKKPRNLIQFHFYLTKNRFLYFKLSYNDLLISNYWTYRTLIINKRSIIVLSCAQYCSFVD